MNGNASPLIASSALRRPRVGWLLAQTAVLLGGNCAPSSSCFLTRRHHNSRNTDRRHFSTAPPRSHTGHEAHTAAGQSLAVRLLQPCSTSDMPGRLHTVPAAHLQLPLSPSGPSSPACGGSPQQGSSSWGDHFVSERSRTSDDDRGTSPTESTTSSFTAEFVRAYWGSLTQGMQLGLCLAEREEMRAEVLTAWLHTRRRQGGRSESTPFAMPSPSLVIQCVAEEVDAALDFFTRSPPTAAATPHTRAALSPSWSSHAMPPAGDEQRERQQQQQHHAHLAAWHVFCLRTLFEAAVAQTQRQGDEQQQQQQRERVRLLLHRLVNQPAVPLAVLDTLIPIVTRTTLADGESARRRTWEAETAALRAGRAVQWAPVQFPAARGEEDVEERREGTTGPWLMTNVAVRTERQRKWRRHPPRPGAKALPGRTAHVPVEEATSCPSLEKVWAHHYRSLVVAALPAAPLKLLRGDAGLRSYTQHLRQLLQKSAEGNNVAFVDALASLMGRVTATDTALAELVAFLFATSSPAERGQLYKSVAEESATPRGAAPIFWIVATALSSPSHSSMLDILARTVAADTAHAGTLLPQMATRTALADVIAATQSTAMLASSLFPSSTSAPTAAGEGERRGEATEANLCLAARVARATAAAIEKSTCPVDSAFAARCVVRLGEELLSCWRLADAAHDRQYRFSPQMESAVWAVYIPLATRLLQRTAADNLNAVHWRDVASSALTVCVELNYLWDAAVCPQRQQHRRLARRTPATRIAALCDEMLKDMTLNGHPHEAVTTTTNTAPVVADSRDYPAPHPVPQRTERYASLLLALVSCAADVVGVQDSATLSRLCSAALIVLREIDTASAAGLLAGLDTLATPLLERQQLDARAALALLRCTAAPRCGCPAPHLAVKYFSAALRAERGCAGTTSLGGKQVDWSGEGARVVTCLAQSVMPHAERCAAVTRFTAFLRASGVELNVAAHTTLQQSFARGRRTGLFSGAPWCDTDQQYRVWLSEEAYMPLLLQLSELQLSCARSFLALGAWQDAAKYLPTTETRQVARSVLSSSAGFVFRDLPSRQREDIATHHTLLYLCATDVTKSCEVSAKAVSLHLLNVSPEPVKKRFWYVWQRWYRSSRRQTVPAPPVLPAGAFHHPHFRPMSGQRFVPAVPLSVEREAELRLRFTHTGDPSYLARCLATLHRGRAGVPSSTPSVHNVSVSTCYAGVAAALRNRTG